MVIDYGPRTTAPEENCPPDNPPLDDKISPKNNFYTQIKLLHSSKFPQKSSTSEVRRIIDGLRVL